jgi:hypothetical protein
MYFENRQHGRALSPDQPVRLPAGFALFPNEALAEEIRSFFRPLRKPSSHAASRSIVDNPALIDPGGCMVCRSTLPPLGLPLARIRATVDVLLPAATHRAARCGPLAARHA